MMAAAYVWSHFVAACGEETSSVYVTGGAMETAEADFNLASQSAVTEFIGGGGCERPEYIRTAPFENWTGDPPPPDVDSYSFYSGPEYGYLAYWRHPKTGKWIIKSLKKNSKFGGFFPLAKLFKKD
jgi:hypothetical protein